MPHDSRSSACSTGRGGTDSPDGPAHRKGPRGRSIKTARGRLCSAWSGAQRPYSACLQHPAEAAQTLRVSVPSAAELEVPHQSVYDRMPSTPRGGGPIRTFRGSLRDAVSPYAAPGTQRLERFNRLSSSQQRWQGLAGKLLSNKAQQRLLRGALKQEVKDVQDDGAGTAHARLWRQPSLNQHQWDQQLSAYQAERSSDLSRGNERPATVHGTSRFNDDHLKDTASSRFNYKHR